MQKSAEGGRAPFCAARFLNGPRDGKRTAFPTGAPRLSLFASWYFQYSMGEPVCQELLGEMDFEARKTQSSRNRKPDGAPSGLFSFGFFPRRRLGFCLTLRFPSQKPKRKTNAKEAISSSPENCSVIPLQAPRSGRNHDRELISCNSGSGMPCFRFPGHTERGERYADQDHS